MNIKMLLIPFMIVSFPSFADITVGKNSIVCEDESGIIAVTAMKELKKVRNLPNSCRTLDFKRTGNIVNAKNRHYVKVETKVGDDFYTLTKWIKN